MKAPLLSKLILIGIVLLAFVLRFWGVTTNPPALNWDEAAIGYNAYSVLTTGRDEWGEVLPLHFRSYGEYKLPAQIYASIPGVAIFGLTELGVRITPVVYGTITVLLLYFLARELIGNKYIGYISAFMLAVSPWHIHLTRASFESSFSVMWMVLGIWLALMSFRKRQWLILSAVSFAIGIYTYNSARVFIPLFLFVAFIVYRKDFLVHKKNLLLATLVFVVLLLPLIPFTISGDVANRYKLVSILDDPGLVPRIDEARNLSTLPDLPKRLVHNRVTYTARTFALNYVAHFTPDYLFINGAGHKQHHVQGVGQLYFVQAPFVLAGLYFLFKNKAKYRWLIVFWILFAFIPVSITRDSIPHALRTVLAAPAYGILTAYGFWEVLNFIKNKNSKKLLVGLVSIILLMNFGTYLANFATYPKLYSRDWQYGYKEVVGFIKDNYDKYDKIVFTRHYGEPHMFTLFYMSWDANKFQNDPNLNRFETFDWVRVLSFDKFYFPDLGDIGTQYADIVSENPGKKLLFIGKPGDFPQSISKLKEVNFLDGKKAFEIVESE